MKNYYERWKKLKNKKNLSGQEALLAVEQNGYALRYVKDQTEDICRAAVEQNEDALRYVEEKFLKHDYTGATTLE